MAAACGIDVNRISAWTFAYGSGLAGVAGVLLAGFKAVIPDMGESVVVDGFLVVVVGGVGSLLERCCLLPCWGRLMVYLPYLQ